MLGVCFELIQTVIESDEKARILMNICGTDHRVYFKRNPVDGGYMLDTTQTRESELVGRALTDGHHDFAEQFKEVFTDVESSLDVKNICDVVLEYWPEAQL